MKESILMCVWVIVILGMNSVLVAQTRTKEKPKTKARISKPVQKPTYVGETEKNLSKTETVKRETEAAVFEPNDANTWIRNKPTEGKETAEPNNGDRKIMDIVDMAKQPAGQNSTQNNQPTADGKAKQNAGAPSGAVKKPVVFEDVIISSKTTKPKRKPTKSAASKRRPN